MNMLQRCFNSFESIGRSKATKLPEGAEPIDRLMHELYVAGRLRTAANTRYEAAKSAVVKVVGLKAVEAVKPGENKNLSQGRFYNLLLKVNQAPAPKCDPDKFLAELLERGVDSELVKEALAASMVDQTPAKTFIVTAKEEETVQ